MFVFVHSSHCAGRFLSGKSLFSLSFLGRSCHSTLGCYNDRDNHKRRSGFTTTKLAGTFLRSVPCPSRTGLMFLYEGVTTMPIDRSDFASSALVSG